MPMSVEKDSRKKAGDKRSSSSRNVDLLCSVKYKNNLPDVPFGPKFLSYPFDSQRYIQYNPTSLERNHKHELLTEVDLGVPIDLILPETYINPDPTVTLHPTDEALLEEEVVQQPESKRARQHARNVSWLRRTEYISTEYARPHSGLEGGENKVGYNVKKKLQSMDTYKDRAGQISAIEATFESAKQPIKKHYSKPGVVAKGVLPVFPDFEMWKLPFAQVIFDSDPAVAGKTPSQQSREMSRAMIRGMMDENNEQFVAYFLPTPETLQTKLGEEEETSEHEPDQECEYTLTREYNWNVKNKASKGYEETYFFVARPNEGIFYNEIETRVRLSKRRGRAAKSAMNSKLIVKHREMTEEELYAQDVRLSQLEPPVLEEEEEEWGLGEEEGEGEGEGEEKEATTPTSPTDGEEGEEGAGGQGSERDEEFEQAFGSDED